MVAAIDGDLGMTKAAASLMGAAFLALGLISLSSAAEAQRWVYPPERVNWKVGPGYFGFSGYPWPGPPFAWPDVRPTYGCYFTRARLKNAWRQVEVCS
jgi:hypothetical protein